jgi:DNA-binding transcriptional ArsR family regulator
MIDSRLEREVTLLHERICPGFADPKRVLIIYLLAERQMCVNEMVGELGLPQSSVSRHLRVLREHGMVQTERRGTSVYYTLTDARLVQALDLLRAVLASQIAAAVDLARSLD